jgi:alcohol dehydrogenase class IV
MSFTFSAPGRIIFGPGAAAEIRKIAVELGTRVCVVAGANPGRAGGVIDGLNREGLNPIVLSIRGEPTVEDAAQGADAARSEGCDLVVSVGGGGALDAGKAIAALLTNHDPIAEYLEIIGPGRAIAFPPAPHIAVPTTAGTGAEATANAVLLSKEHKVKVSMRSKLMLPAYAIVDPELTRSMPPEVTATTGLDALTQLLEAFVSKFANPMTDCLCREGLARAGRSLRKAHADGENLSAREDMSLAALFSGLALANAKLGAVHGFAAPLGGLFPAPHGAVCAALLPHVIEANLKALKEREPDSPSLSAYAEAARIMTGDPAARPEDGAAFIRDLCEAFALPSLAAYGLAESDFPDVAAKADRASSMKGNPVRLTLEELAGILRRAF